MHCSRTCKCKVCFLLRGGPLPQLGAADESVSEPSFTWKVVTRETSKETCNIGDSFVPRTPPREAPLSLSASDELPATPTSKKINLKAFGLGLLLFSQLDPVVLNVVGTT